MRNYYYVLLLCFGILISSCKKDNDVYSPGGKDATSIAEILSITDVSVSSLPADTQTTSTISVQITKGAAVANRTLSISTDLGMFSNGKDTASLRVDAEGKGQFQVRSAKIGKAVVSVKLKNTIVNTSVTFVAAMPDDMLISADKYLLDTSQSANILVSLSRDPGNGMVSDPVKVNFTISGVGAEQLQLPAFTNSNSTAATVTLANPFGITGTFKISASALNQKGTSIVRTIDIKIK